MPALTALLRPVSAALESCELTHIARQSIDIAAARSQHDAYAAALAAHGCALHWLPAADHHADAVFIEDTAVVLPELAVLTRPGAPSRRPEVDAVRTALSTRRMLREIAAPGTLDGGDVLRLGRTLFVGASGRSNAAGIRQLREAVAPFDYAVIAVETRGCLHLKTAVTAVADDTLLINRDWVDADVFGGMRCIDVAAHEPFAANALRIGEFVVLAAAWTATAERLATAGVRLHTVDVSELAKAEGGVTCCSLILED
jgi:dimethylargininase